MFEKRKIDLHLHFDGSLPLDTAWKLAQRHPDFSHMKQEEFYQQMQVDEHCHSLYDYLARFDAPLKLLQDEDALYQGMFALIEALQKQGLCYAEIRFAPQQHTHKSLKQEDVVKILLKARNDALSCFPDIKVNFILCMMILGEERMTHEANLETIRLCNAYLGQGIVALDLAGAEGMIPMEDFASLLTMANTYKLPLILHAGESYGAANITAALRYGARRIGHGTSAIQDPCVMEALRKKQIPLEVCITSNVNCEVVAGYEQHPIHDFLQYGIPVTINTDNMTISHTDLDQEYAYLMNYQGFHEEDIAACLQASIHAAFLREEEKQELFDRWQ